ncbi:unnamed protein product [Ambrosiozyma monospora]|uniref:Unnamed protein product n=1 Tax=Ambrosiozyma monospora TaxID=43982 RepID=A0ACB5SWW4_AMBMO|nr:unnamed protein product [Ambrosiozyma monospora]
MPYTPPSRTRRKFSNNCKDDSSGSNSSSSSFRTYLNNNSSSSLHSSSGSAAISGSYNSLSMALSNSSHEDSNNNSTDSSLPMTPPIPASASLANSNNNNSTPPHTSVSPSVTLQPSSASQARARERHNAGQPQSPAGGPMTPVFQQVQNQSQISPGALLSPNTASFNRSVNSINAAYFNDVHTPSSPLPGLKLRGVNNTTTTAANPNSNSMTTTNTSTTANLNATSPSKAASGSGNSNNNSNSNNSSAPSHEEVMKFSTESPQSYSYTLVSPNSLALRLGVLKRSLQILIDRPEWIKIKKADAEARARKLETATSLSDAEETSTSTLHHESSSSTTTTTNTTDIPPPNSRNTHKPYLNPPLASPDTHNYMSAPSSPIIPRRTLSAGSGLPGMPNSSNTSIAALGPPQKPPMLSRRRSSYAVNMMDNLMRFESRKANTSVSNLLMIHQQNEAQQQQLHNQQLQQEQYLGQATFELMEPRERLRQRFISKSQESLSLPSSPTISHSSSSTSIGLGFVPSLDPAVASKVSQTNADTASITSQESVSTTNTAVTTSTTNNNQKAQSQETDDEQMYKDLKAIVEFLENSGGSLLEDWSHNANYVDLHNLSLSNVNQFSKITNLKINLLEALATPFTDKPTQTTTTTTTVASGSSSTSAVPGATPGLNVSNNRMIGGLTLSRASPSVIGLNQLNSSSSAASSSSSITTSTPTTVTTTTTTTTTSTANTTGRQYHMGSAGKNMQPKAIFTCELESPWDLKNANDIKTTRVG